MRELGTVTQPQVRALNFGIMQQLGSGFSPRYELDRVWDVISRIGHSVEDQSVKDRILVIPTVNALDAMATGDVIRMDPQAKTITVLSRAATAA